MEIYKEAIHKGIVWNGKRVGNYTVLGLDRIHVHPNKKTSHYWKVICDCGEIRSLNYGHLTSGRVTQCNKCATKKLRGINSPHWKGGRFVPGYFVARCKAACVRGRELEFLLTLEYLDRLWEEQEGLCFYTGWPLVFGDNATVQTASLDRIDSSMGYIEGNVRFVHKEVNIMKWELSHSRFLEICRAISERN